MTGEQNRSPADTGPRPRIVVGVSDRAASDAAVDWAVNEARLRRAHLHLVLARDPAVFRRAAYAQPAATRGGDAAWLAQAATRAARLLGPDQVTAELADGLPARVLMDRAADASLLVLGAATTADVVGPVASACLRRAPCPVVIVAPDSDRAAMPGPRRPATPDLDQILLHAGHARAEGAEDEPSGDRSAP
jgi:nucleotide-binding universal stress UspA family protein